MATRMQQRRGTAAQWVSTNSGAGPVLNAGEIGWESDTNKFKIGDGTNAWSSLTYFLDITDLGGDLDDYILLTQKDAASGVASLDVNKNLIVPGASIIVEGATANAYETTLTATDPTAARTVTFKDESGTVAYTADITVSASSTNTFSNKSISLGSNTVTSTLAQLNTAITDADVASLASPTFTGTPTLPTGTIATTQSAGNNSTAIATTAYADAAVAALVDAAPATLNTLNELADALGDDASFAATTATSLGLKAPLASPTFTGTVTIPSGASISGFALLAGPTFTGTTTLADGAVLGTPLSGTLTNATGLPVSTGISGLGSNVATFLATPSSANFASMITDEIGTGEIVLSELATNAQTASYTLVLADKGKLVEMNVASANTLTVPLNATVAWPVGSSIDILQMGAGQTTIVATAGVTINSTPGLKIRTQYASATLIKRATNTWILIGDLSA